LWELTTDEELKLLGPQATVIADAERSSEPVEVSKNTLLRISAVFGIYAALESLLPGRSRRWIRYPNRAKLFNGRAPLEMMMSDSLDDLLTVRRYLDAQFT
ncbi:MbcA/ParS/Xre antitoxin family protein, partial [Escherichia coli]|uniref:MbcA/ParS/Xre antitoxin family protein n=1 Tax=Escherichia coli TaxID=562 RepID=UPI001BFC4960